MLRFVMPLLVLFAMQLSANDDPAVFKSDVAMTRADAQVVDRDGRAITGLQVQDFILRLDGRVVPIRNFASENMPIDIVLLIDVSGSMQPHVERIASAAQRALNVLADRDRVAIMVFDTYTRVRLPFRSSHGEITAELNRLLRSERFNGGTRITHALLDAASYAQREARQNARRAIVILTDDQTQDQEDETRVGAALTRANAVLSFLQAPYELPGMTGGGRPHGTWGIGGGTWPGGGIGFPGSGPIVLGRGRRGGYGGGDRSHSAGTADIARDSGGDTMQVDEASSLEETLARLRQRYALYFYLPEGSTLADQRNVRVDLSQETRLRFQQAEIHYRRIDISATGSGDGTGPTVVTRTNAPADTPIEPSRPRDEPRPKGRRVAVNENTGSPVNIVDPDSDDAKGQSNPSAAPSAQLPQSGGWPRATHPTTPPE